MRRRMFLAIVPISLLSGMALAQGLVDPVPPPVWVPPEVTVVPVRRDANASFLNQLDRAKAYCMSRVAEQDGDRTLAYLECLNMIFRFEGYRVIVRLPSRTDSAASALRARFELARKRCLPTSGVENAMYLRCLDAAFATGVTEAKPLGP